MSREGIRMKCLFCEKWCIKGYGVGHRGGASPHKHLLSTPLPQVVKILTAKLSGRVAMMARHEMLCCDQFEKILFRSNFKKYIVAFYKVNICLKVTLTTSGSKMLKIFIMWRQKSFDILTPLHPSRRDGDFQSITYWTG